ncbi:MAG: hypothetical protein VX000_10850, partial [Myxococcota bacterium]|nr:hypothetical protein [Myxococcota bacterium]
DPKPSRTALVSAATNLAATLFEGGWSLHALAKIPIDKDRNGNLLITESQDGRAFELTPDKEIVWDYRWDEWSADDPGLVAMLFDVQRIAADHPGLSFLGGRGLDDQGSRSRQSTAPGR